MSEWWTDRDDKGNLGGVFTRWTGTGRIAFLDLTGGEEK